MADFFATFSILSAYRLHAVVTQGGQDLAGAVIERFHRAHF